MERGGGGAGTGAIERWYYIARVQAGVQSVARCFSVTDGSYGCRYSRSNCEIFQVQYTGATIILLGLQSRFGDKLLSIRVFCPQNGTLQP